MSDRSIVEACRGTDAVTIRRNYLSGRIDVYAHVRHWVGIGSADNDNDLPRAITEAVAEATECANHYEITQEISHQQNVSRHVGETPSNHGAIKHEF